MTSPITHASVRDTIATIDAFDLTKQGFSSSEIETMYYANEPMMRALIEAASQLTEHERFLSLAIIKVIATVGGV